ncbi:CDP-glucose 4,6-dehydratase [Rhodoplanes sp. TEM]|uniref:CDP-glucose 4,6-dehydratase n=1 Tax=Rhodoplanes tepidamans TaxID=200616 RepID=A0ABT5J4K2_RHOTP|nr:MULTISPECIES: CDP-glucose 4,6-dehydratase [Rhodoplanes]MDC7784341.1 CDP-glucose 4,6-dehydratase [Rhodoplanes tepidamans]MDC7983395.1 CDP-glucose 4,6-dehydratase [Rhodoplanes sp. TEM]
MEDVVIDPAFWAGRRVLITGHTGFKGAWASLLLGSMGAEVTGLALPPETDEGLFVAAGLAGGMRHRIGDIRDLATVRDAVAAARPQIVVHMAAQSLVRLSYDDPVGTYATNVMGTVNVLEAVRHAPDVEAVLVVTSDKCYENVGWVWGYREIDRLGGHDPYSNSKGCAELVADAYRRSFFGGEGAARVATVRAGNVIGGGDFARDRLVPDAIRAFRAGRPLRIRNPLSIRPWQHVLDPVIGYLRLAERLAAGVDGTADAWNFGPGAASEVPVAQIADTLVRLWRGRAAWEQDPGEHPHEAHLLKLDCTKATTRLGWRPLVGLDAALGMVVDWYKALDGGADMRAVTLGQIAGVLASAR